MLYLQNIAFFLTCTLNNLLRFQIAKWLREMYNLETQCRLNNWKLIISKIAHEKEPIKHVLSIKSNFSFQSVTERKGYRLLGKRKSNFLLKNRFTMKETLVHTSNYKQFIQSLTCPIDRGVR